MVTPSIHNSALTIQKRYFLPLFLLFFIVLLSSMSVSAATYYVATTGNDSSGDGGISNPWSTISYTLTQVSAGDTVKIKAGTYDLGSNTIYINDPVNHANLTLTGEDPLNRPVLSFNNSASINIRVSTGVKGVNISNLEISSGASRRLTWGTSIRVDDNPVVVDNCEIYNGFVGIAINTGKNVTISNNLIHTMGNYETNPDNASGSGCGIAAYNFDGSIAATGWNEKIYIYNNEVYDVAEDGFINVNTNYKYIEVAYNRLHDNYEDGLDWKDTQYVKIHHNKLYNNWGNGIGYNNSYPSTDFEIWNNEICGNGWYGIVSAGSNWKLWNNLIYNNCSNPAYWGANGIQLLGSGSEFYNNVVFNNTVPGSQSNAGYVGNAIVRNNIFFNNAPQNGGNIRSDSGGIIEYNYVYPTTAGIIGTNTITDPDPKFADGVNGDFTLQSDSPLINKGIDAGITDDYLGNPRPNYGGYDMGAYEYTVKTPKLKKK